MKRVSSVASAAFLIVALAGCTTAGLSTGVKLDASSLSAKRTLTRSHAFLPLSKLNQIQGMTLKSKKRTVQASLPSRVDLRAEFPPISHQGITNACSAFASVDGLSEFLAKKQGQPLDYSPRFIWNLVRKSTGELEQNAGVDYRDAMKEIAKTGLVPETDFPFPTSAQQESPSTFAHFLSEVPSAAMMKEAARHRVFTEIRTLGSADEMKESVASGMPVVFGIAVYPNIDSGKNGEIPLPQKGIQPVGGHIMLCIGYDEAKQQFIVRNSWGADWGDHGYGYLPYAYITPEWAHVGMTAKL